LKNVYKTIKSRGPGKRVYVLVDKKEIITTDEPYKPLLIPLKKELLETIMGELLDKKDIPAKVETIEYDPFRSAFIALVCYKDGERRYILAPDGIKVGDEIIVSENAPLEVGNRLPLKNINPGTPIYNLEIEPNGGGKLIRAAGSSGIMMGIEGKYAIVKMPSGEIRKFLADCWASIGQVSNPDHRNINLGKAGASRHRGRRPHVRGSAMNAVDHPYGGGEGKTTRGTRRPKDPWGNITGGRKTRNK
jgi:large subunit ribosomal protein L2